MLFPFQPAECLTLQNRHASSMSPEMLSLSTLCKAKNARWLEEEVFAKITDLRVIAEMSVLSRRFTDMRNRVKRSVGFSGDMSAQRWKRRPYCGPAVSLFCRSGPR